ncbi:MAG: OmpA family protein [Pseudomonadota bacterium]|nr:OmpA family protein [Pseudomonadota bacterium]
MRDDDTSPDAPEDAPDPAAPGRPADGADAPSEPERGAAGRDAAGRGGGRLLFAAGLAGLALLAGPGAWIGAGEVGRISAARGAAALDAIGAGWAQVDPDGLRLTLAGAYPDETAHRAALAAVAMASPMSRLEDAARHAAPPRSGPVSGSGAGSGSGSDLGSGTRDDDAPPRVLRRDAGLDAPVLLAAAGDAPVAAVAEAEPAAAAPTTPPASASAPASSGSPASGAASSSSSSASGAAAVDPPRQPGQVDAPGTGPGETAAPAPGGSDGTAPDAAAAPATATEFGSPLTLARAGDSLVAAGAAHPDRVAALRETWADIDGAPALTDATVPRRAPPDADRLALARAAAAAVAGLGEARAELAPGVLSLSALAPSREAADAAEAALRETAPEGSTLLLDISAPPPALKPFRFGVALGPSGPALLSCDMRSAAERREVLDAVAALPGAAPRGPGAGLCRLGVGAPSQRWGGAAAEGVRALGALGGGRFEMIDADARLVAAPSAGPARFARVSRDLAARLPPAFSLHLVPPPPARGPRPPSGIGETAEAGEDGAPRWFALDLGPDGAIDLAGGAPDAASRAAVAAYARARFGAPAVNDAMALADAAPPPTWRRAALAGIDALRPLDRGRLSYDGEALVVQGASLRPAAAREADAALDPLRALGVAARSVVTVDLPTLAARLPLPPAECLAALKAEVEADPIGFAPGETAIEAGSGAVLDRLAAILTRCGGLVVEIGGHTDSQGRESTNLALSQGRAAAVRDALFARGAPLSRMVAQGYGESRPIADNGDEAGRALNRRIAFSDAALTAAEWGDGDPGEDETAEQGG